MIIPKPSALLEKGAPVKSKKKKRLKPNLCRPKPQRPQAGDRQTVCLLLGSAQGCTSAMSPVGHRPSKWIIALPKAANSELLPLSRALRLGGVSFLEMWNSSTKSAKDHHSKVKWVACQEADQKHGT